MIFKFLFVILFLGILTNQANSANKHDWMEHAVNLFNGIFFNSNIWFVYDFGSGVSVLHGTATVSTWTPVELTFSSNYKPIENGTLYYFEVNLPVSHVDYPADSEGRTGFQMINCRMELQFQSQTNWKGHLYANTPTSVLLSNCDSIAYYDNTPVVNGDQIVLPLLSQALLVTAKEQLSYYADSRPPYNYLQKWSTFQEEVLYSIIY